MAKKMPAKPLTKQTVYATKQWQVYIPKEMRQALKLREPGPFEITTNGQEITLRPTKKSILDFAGAMKKYAPKEPVDIDNIRDYIDYSEL